MLRPLRNALISPRILPFRGTNDGSDSIDDTYGAQDITFTYDAAGTNSLNYVDIAERGSVVIASPGTDVADAGYVALDSTIGTTANTGFDLDSFNASGSADAGTFYGLAVTYRSNVVIRTQPRGNDVYNAIGSGRLLTFDIDSDGTVNKGISDATAVKNSTGNYTLTFAIPFGSNDVIACGTVINAAGGAITIESVNATTVNVKTFDETDSAADLRFHLFVHGQKTNTELGRRYALVGVTQPKTRMVCGLIKNTSGTYSIELGTNEFSLTDNGVGDLTVTWTAPFAQAPQVVGIGGASRCFLASAPTTTSANFNTTNAAYSASESHISFVAIGTDNLTEY